MAGMGKRLDKLSHTLGKLLQARGLQNHLSEYRIFGQWDKTVGAVIARHARPLSLRGKKLYLAVDSPAWMQQLSLLKPEIIEKFNKGLGKDAVKDIVLNLGEVSSSAMSGQETPPVRADLNANDREKIEQYVKEIHDDKVRQALRRVIEKDFLCKKVKQKD